jgi:hypothetical protein
MSEEDNWGNMGTRRRRRRRRLTLIKLGIIDHNKKILDDYTVSHELGEEQAPHRYIRKKLLNGEYNRAAKTLINAADDPELYNTASEELKNKMTTYFPENLPNYKPFYDTKHFLSLYSTLEIIETVVTFNNYYEYYKKAQYIAFIKKVKKDVKENKQWVKNFVNMIKGNDNFFECFKKTCLDKKNGMKIAKRFGNSGKLFLNHLRENLEGGEVSDENGSWEQATDIYFQQFEDNFMIKLEKATKKEIYENAIDGLKPQSGGKKKGTRRRKRKSKSKTKRKSL